MLEHCVEYEFSPYCSGGVSVPQGSLELCCCGSLALLGCSKVNWSKVRGQMKYDSNTFIGVRKFMGPS